MFNWLIANKLEETNQALEKGNRISARDKAAELKVRKESLRNEADEAWNASIEKLKEANRLADRTFVMRILAEAPHGAKVTAYYTKKWREISEKHKILLGEWNTLKQNAEALEADFKNAHKEWYNFKERYDLWNDNYC